MSNIAFAGNCFSKKSRIRPIKGLYTSAFRSMHDRFDLRETIQRATFVLKIAQVTLQRWKVAIDALRAELFIMRKMQWNSSIIRSLEFRSFEHSLIIYVCTRLNYTSNNVCILESLYLDIFHYRENTIKRKIMVLKLKDKLNVIERSRKGCTKYTYNLVKM